MKKLEKPYPATVQVCYNLIHNDNEEKALACMIDHMDGDEVEARDIIRSMKAYQNASCIEFSECKLSDVDKQDDPLFEDEYHPYSLLSRFFAEYNMSVIQIERFRGINGAKDTFIQAGTPFRLDESKITQVWRTIRLNNDYKKKIAAINAAVEDFDEDEDSE